MGGFDKIELKPGSANGRDFAKSEGKQDMGRRKKFNLKNHKKLSIALAIIGVFLIILAIPAFATYKSGLKAYREAKLISAALKTQDIELASVEIDKTKKELTETQKNFRYLIPLKFIPIVNFYYNDADHMLNAGSRGLDTAKIVVDSIKPYADVLGLKGKGSFSGGSAEDRIKTAVLTVSKITPQIDKIAESMKLVDEEVSQINPGHYPTFIFGKKINQQLNSIRNLTKETTTLVTDAKPLVKVLPSLLGETEEKKYLVIFQNDKELRATGGFITAYAIFRVDKGVIKLNKSEDIYALDDSIPNKSKAPAPILRYLPKVYTLNLRDSNLSPDFVKSMETFREMYERSSKEEKIDGIIALDTSVLVSTVHILDDTVTAGGITFNTKNDPRCDCPQVIYELEDNISRPVNFIKADRKGLLGQLLSAIMTKALSSSPKLYWGPLFQSFLGQADQKHVLFYLYNEDAQKGLESLNAAGRIKDFEGDYLHINEVSFSGAKVNIFLEQEVENSYEIKDGVITKTVTMKYKNPHPPSDCNLERGALCLNAEYRDWFRIYVPKGSELVESKGSQVKITTSEDLGKTVFEGFLTVRPKGASTFKITYKLPFKVKGGSLPLLIQKQPGTGVCTAWDSVNAKLVCEGFKYSNVVNGRTVEEFELLTDKEVTLKL